MTAKPEKIPYWELLRRPEWQRKRLEIMQRDDFTCLRCKDKDESLVVHHSYYISGRDPWMYPDFSLLTLCKSCHDREHENTGTQGWELVAGEVFGMNEFIDPNMMLYIAEIIDALKKTVSREEISMAMLDSLLRLWDDKHHNRPPLSVNFNAPFIKPWLQEKYPSPPIGKRTFSSL